MPRDVVTVVEDTDLGDVAALLEARRVKRVPVMPAGKIVGIISRANLVRALGSTRGASPRPGESDDRTIRSRLLTELGREEWAKVWPEDVFVRVGVVHFCVSQDETQEKRHALRVAAENIAGVRAVEKHDVPTPAIPSF